MPGTSKTALVIGCGYLGARLLRELTGIGWQATGITLSESSAEILRNQGLQVAAADLRTSDYQLLTKNNPAVIIHCASSGSEVAAGPFTARFFWRQPSGLSEKRAANS